MRYPLVSLADVVVSRPGTRDPAALSSPTFRYVDLESVDRVSKRIATPKVTPSVEAPSRARKVIRANDVLVALVRPNLNTVALVPPDLDDEIASTGFCILRATERVLPLYLYFAVRSPAFVARLCGMVSGALYPAVTERQVLGQRIPLPDIREQQRVVDLLSRAEYIVRTRRKTEAKAKNIAPSLFLDMFGDPAANPKGWTTRRLGDLAVRMSDGPFGTNLKSSHYVETGIRVIRLQNIGVGEFLDDDKAYVSPEHFATLAKHRCLPGDVIVGTLGDPNLRAAVLPGHIEEALNKADCVQLRVNPTAATAQYICALLNQPSTLAMASRMVQGITRTRISMGRLRELHVPVPALGLQRQFAERIMRLQSLVRQQQLATRLAESSLGTLLAEFFRQ